MPFHFSRKNRHSLDLSQDSKTQSRPLIYAQSSYAPSLAESAAPTIDTPSLAESATPTTDACKLAEPKPSVSSKQGVLPNDHGRTTAAPSPAEPKPKVFVNRYYDSATIITRTAIDYMPREVVETKTNESEIEEAATDKELGFERPRTPPKGKRKHNKVKCRGSIQTAN